MARQPRVLAVMAGALMLSSLIAPLAAATSHYALSVTLYNDSAEGKTNGQNFTVWAQVYVGGVPTNATTLNFRFGFGVLSTFFPATTYAGVYAGSPGLYKAVVTLTPLDVALGITGLAVFAALGNDSADTMRIVATAVAPTPPPPPGPWTMAAGVENLAELGRTIDPGETVVWRVDTYQSGVHTNSSNLSLQLFEAPDVNFTETPTNLTPTWVADGVYEARMTVPASLSEGRQYVLRAVLNESNLVQVDASADVWFYDTVVSYTKHNSTLLEGTLTVGDGVIRVPGLAVALELSQTANATHSIGWINGTTDASGNLTFSVANDRSYLIDARGWINGTHAQFIAGSLNLSGDFAPAPNPTKFDAVPLENISLVPWEGVQTLWFQFYHNGTLWNNSTVVSIVSDSRGPWAVTNLTTDANGTAGLAVNFTGHAPVLDDTANLAPNSGVDPRRHAAINLTFRAPVGNDSRASDGRWWGEDEEIGMPSIFPQLASALFDRNLTFDTEPLAIGPPFGVGAKYTGGKNVAGFEGAAVLVPGSENLLLGGYTEAYDIWTGHGEPYASLLVSGGGTAEYFGSAGVPAYWPNTTYTLFAAVVPSLSHTDNVAGLTMGAFNWVRLSPGEALAGFTRAPDSTPPLVLGPNDITINSGDTARFATVAYDDSLDFHSAANYSWSFNDGYGPVTLYGASNSWIFNVPGDFVVTLTVFDGTGNVAVRPFFVHVLDHTAPVVNAGPDFSTVAGALAWFNATASDDDRGFPGNATLGWSFVYNNTTVNITGKAGNFTFWQLGNYNLTFTATDAAGNTASDVVAVTVSPPDTLAPTVGAGPDRTTPAGVALDFNGTASDNDPNFANVSRCGWSFTYNSTLIAVNGSDFNATFWTLGPVDLLYYCYDGWGNLGQDTARVTVVSPDTQPPVVQAGADITVNRSTAVDFNGTATDNDPAFPAGAAFYWIFTYNGTPYNRSGASFTFTFDAPGQYLVTLWVRDGWGNLGSAVRRVTVVIPDTQPPMVPGVGDRTITAGDWLNLTGGVTDNDPTFATTGTETWSFMGPSGMVTRSGDAFSFLFDTAGNFSLTLAARDAAGNIATASFVVHVLPRDVTAPSVTAAADHLFVLTGSTVTFTGSAVDDGAPITDGTRFLWTFSYNGMIETLMGLTPSYVFGKAGTYTVTLTVRDNAGNAGTSQVTVTVTEPSQTPTPAGPGLAVYLLILLLVIGGVGAYLWSRRRGAKPAPAAKKVDAPASKPAGGRAGARGVKDPTPAALKSKDDDTTEDEDKDLDDLLK